MRALIFLPLFFGFVKQTEQTVTKTTFWAEQLLSDLHLNWEQAETSFRRHAKHLDLSLWRPAYHQRFILNDKTEHDVR